MNRPQDQGVALQTDVPRPTPARLVGRSDVLAIIETQVAAGRSVVLTGPSGIGKTSVIDAIGARATERGERVLRVAGAETERWISYAGLADLLSQMPAALLAQLPDPQRTAANAVLLRSNTTGTGSRAVMARGLALQALLEHSADAGPSSC